MDEKINKKYEYPEDETSEVREPATAYNARVNPDTGYYSYADYLTWDDDMKCLKKKKISQFDIFFPK
jgi:hypothetical protein